MAKIIKKITRSLIITIAVLLLIPAIGIPLLRAPKFQTFIVHRFSSFISNKLGTQISVGHVSYTFFNKLVLYDILIKDQNKDTLIAAKQLSIKIRDFKPSEQRFIFGKAEIYEPDFRMIKDTTGILNLNWYISMLRGNKERDTLQKTDISIPEIEIHDGSYTLRDQNAIIHKPAGMIDFSNLMLESLNGTLKGFRIIPDTVSFSIEELSFNDPNGFKVSSAGTKTVIAGNSLYFRNIEILTDSSSIKASYINILPYDSAAYNDFLNRVKLEADLNRSLLHTSDLSFFIQPLKEMNEEVFLSGRLSGTIADLRGRHIEMEHSGITKLLCDFDISGLPAINGTYIYIDFTEMQTNADDIESISLPGKGPLAMPPVLHDLGQISFSGSFTGFTTDFVAFGTLQTERGHFTGDISFKPGGNNAFTFKGLLTAGDVDLGYIARNNDVFGKGGFHVDIEGSLRSFNHLSANINGVIDSVMINDYLYRNVSLTGTFADKVWDGNVTVRDKNIMMDILGRFDLASELPEFDFTMNLSRADLTRLNLYKKDTLFRASALITATFKGNNIDNLDGDLRLINSTLVNSGGEINIYDFLIKSGSENGIPLLTLRSDFADCEVRGQHTYASLGTATKTMLAMLFPTKFTMPASREKLKENNFTFNAKVKKLNKLTQFMGNQVRIAEGSMLNGFFYADSTTISADITSPEIEILKSNIRNLSLTGSIDKSRMSMLLNADNLILPGNPEMKNFVLSLSSHPDTMNMAITWDNKSDKKSFGEIRSEAFFSLNRRNKTVLNINILPTELYVNDIKWDINPASVIIDSTKLVFNNILAKSENSYLNLDGKISSNPHDRLTFGFEGIDLRFLNNFGKKDEQKNEQSVQMTFAGIIKGDITLSDLYNNFLFESDVKVADFLVNNSDYGNVSVSSEWDPGRKVAVINVSNDFNGAKFFDIKGTYAPNTRIADITVLTSRMPLNVLNPVIKSFASDIRGLGSGKIRLNGKLNQPMLSGSIYAEDASLKVDFLQTRYSFSDSVRFTKKGIEFKSIRIYDEKKNSGLLNGVLGYSTFKDLTIDLNFNINRMMVLNTKPKDNEIFYGTAYATGYAGIKGTAERLAFNISARTENNTFFYVPLNTSETVNDYPYIIFLNSQKEEEAIRERESLLTQKEKMSNIALTFDLDVTPEAEVQLIIDSKAGDVLRGTGAGKLNISLSSTGDLKMSGDYVIEDGDYMFTLGDILNKKFSVEEGGKITWNGSLTDAEMDIKAIYKTKASLYDIYPDEAFRERIPVECQLKLSSQLINPVIGFDIYLPTADEETREYLKMAMNTEEEISRQFLYLLVMNSFYPDPSLYSASSQSSTAQAAIGVTTAEMLFNQVSNLISQISNDFDVGFTYLPGNEITPNELEVALSQQLIDDKVVLNGNFDFSGKQLNTQASNITGDFDIEVKITEKLRFKVFNRSNDNLFYEEAPYTQGFGIFLRRDFNKLKDLFILPENKRKKKNLTSDVEADK